MRYKFYFWLFIAVANAILFGCHIGRYISLGSVDIWAIISPASFAIAGVFQISMCYEGES